MKLRGEDGDGQGMSCVLTWNPQDQRNRERPNGSWGRTIDDETSKAEMAWNEQKRMEKLF